MIDCIEKQGEVLCGGNNIGDFSTEESKEDCARHCYNTTGCTAWNFRITDNFCDLKTSALCTAANEEWIWGSRACEKHVQVPGIFIIDSISLFSICFWAMLLLHIKPNYHFNHFIYRHGR